MTVDFHSCTLCVQIPTLKAKVTKIESVKNVFFNKTEAEVMNCWITDETGGIQIALWDNFISDVYQGNSYNFTNLMTKRYQQKTFLQSTRHTTITPLKIQISTGPLHQMSEDEITPHKNITSALQGVQINISKHCPKCATLQQDFSPQCAFHRCTKCKMLRSGTAYVTKLGGILEFKENKTELSLTVSNSILKRFLAPLLDLGNTDAQDIEQMFLAMKSLTVTFTHNMQVLQMQKTPNDNTDEELLHIEETQLSPEPAALFIPQKTPVKETKHSNDEPFLQIVETESSQEPAALFIPQKRPVTETKHSCKKTKCDRLVLSLYNLYNLYFR